MFFEQYKLSLFYMIVPLTLAILSMMLFKDNKKEKSNEKERTRRN